MTTLAEIAGTTPPPKLDSHSLVPTLLGRGKQVQHEYLYWEFYERGPRQAVLLEGRWKGIRVYGQPASMELYDLQTDLGEETNLAARNPEVVARIEQIMSSAHVDNEHWKLTAQPAKAGAKKAKKQ